MYHLSIICPSIICLSIYHLPINHLLFIYIYMSSTHLCIIIYLSIITYLFSICLHLSTFLSFLPLCLNISPCPLEMLCRTGSCPQGNIHLLIAITGNTAYCLINWLPLMFQGFYDTQKLFLPRSLAHGVLL